MSTSNIYQQLSEPFPPEMEKILTKSGVPLTYIPVSEVVNRLNKVLGADCWSFEITSCYRDNIDTDFVIAHVKLTWLVDGKVIVKDGIGGQKIKRNKRDEIVDLGDEFKGAVSDALKKAAQMLGVGLYLARSDEAMDIEEAMEASPAPQADPAIEEKWQRFVGIVKNFNEAQKTSLNNYWAEFSGGRPKPLLSTAKHEDLDALIVEAAKISMNGEYVSGDN